MKIDPAQRAKTTVELFKNKLNATELAALNETNFGILTDLIEHAIAQELLYALEQIDSTSRELKSHIERPELGL